ncbi:MAG: nucleotidyltransferase domain-containing protein [Thermoleophilaceae bacterium]|nr:nucleotidyltransferase domain-containing protein [Thermoleophilaceae bacterium]
MSATTLWRRRTRRRACETPASWLTLGSDDHRGDDHQGCRDPGQGSGGPHAKIVLFGSHARGNARAGSDLDFWRAPERNQPRRA